MSVIQLLHGTDHIIEVPDIHIGNPHNDYGMGFYCTRVDEMAREWACKKNTDGFVNSYDFDTEGLKVLNLLDGTHTVRTGWLFCFSSAPSSWTPKLPLMQGTILLVTIQLI